MESEGRTSDWERESICWKGNRRERKGNVREDTKCKRDRKIEKF